MRAIRCCCVLPGSKTLNSCCGPSVSQAPAYKIAVSAPASVRGKIGSLVRNIFILKPKTIGTNPTTGYPIHTAPLSAKLQSCQVSTTSRYCGANPDPILAVGTTSPQVGAAVPSGGNVAPTKTSQWWYVAIAAFVLIWMFGGLAVIRRML